MNTRHRHPKVSAAAHAQLDQFAEFSFQVVGYKNNVTRAERLNRLAPTATANNLFFYHQCRDDQEYGESAGTSVQGRYLRGDVAAIVIEPVQSEGLDKLEFARTLAI